MPYVESEQMMDDATQSPSGSAPELSTFAEIVQSRDAVQGKGARPALELRDFSVFYDDFEAVKKVNLGIPRGEVTAIIGPSGCGKSTLLNAVNRMTDLIPAAHTAGTMLLDGADVYGPKMDVVWLRRRIGMVFQKPNPFPKSIYANVAYGPLLHGKRRGADLDQIVERSLREAALWDEVKDRLHTNALGMSGGQQQRLCIARALAIDPEIVLLDEPTSALDPIATGQIENLLEDIRGRYTVIIVTHSMQQAARVSDYTLFMYQGSQIEYSPTVDMFLRPREERTRKYITGKFG